MSHWSSGEDEMLIKFVRTHEALYNIKSKGYRKPQLKQKLWSDIAAVLGKTDTDCSKRWCYVRDYYIRRKGKPGSSGETAKKRSDLLTFLDSSPSPKGSSSTVDDPLSYIFLVPNQGEDAEDGSEPENSKYDVDADDITNENNEEIKLDNNSGDTSGISKENDRKRKYVSQIQERLSPQIPLQKPSCQNELDETDLFFSSMAKIVKKLPRHEQAHLRMQVGLLVGNAELACIKNEPPPSVDSS